MKNLNQIIKNTLRIAVLAFFIYCGAYVVSIGGCKKLSPKYTDCGVVVSKSQDEVAIKHGTRTQLYLNIQFDKSGFKSQEVEPTEYFSSKVGQRKCYDLDGEQTGFDAIVKLIGCVVIFVFCAFCFVAFVAYLIHEPE